MKKAISIVMLLLAIPSSVVAQSNWAFIHAVYQVFEPHADQYMVYQANAQKVAEGSSGPRFWTPIAPGVPSVLRYHFPFSAPTSQVHVRANCSVWNYSLGVGEGSIWGSADGVNWTLLLDCPTPPPGLPSGGIYYSLDTDLPASLVGAHDLWIEMRMTRIGGSYQYGGAQVQRGTPTWPIPVFSVEANFAPSTSSTAVSFGAGCGAPPMVFAPTSTAITGQSVTCEVTSTPTQFCVVALGSNNYLMASVGALPFDLTVAGMTGCILYQSTDVLGLPTYPSGIPFQNSFAMPVPNLPQILGLHFYMQAFSYAPGVNPREFISSNGIDFLVGNQ